MDSPDPAFNDHPVLEGAPSEVSAPLEEGIPVRGHSHVDGIGDGAPSRVAADPILPPKHANTEPSKKRLLD